MAYRVTRANLSDPGLTSLARLDADPGDMPVAEAEDDYTLTPSQSYGRSLLNTASEAALKALINLEAGTDVLAPTGDASAATVTATGSTTARTLAARHAEVANVLDFGAAGDGVTDDSAAVQAAANSLTNGGTLYFPPGRTYKINTMITISNSNVRVMCEGATIDATSLSYVAATRGSGCVFKFAGTFIRSTTLSASASAYDRTVQLTSVTNVQAGDIIRMTSDKILYRNDTAITYYEDYNRIVGISGTTVTLEVPLTLDLTTSGQTVSVFIHRPIADGVVVGGTFLGGGVTENLANGTGRCGVFFEAAAQCGVEGAIFRGFQGIAVFSDSAADIYADNLTIYGIDDDVTITEGQNSGFYGVYFIRTRRGTATEINGIRVRHVIDASDAFEITEHNCRGSRTHRAAFGSHEGVHELHVSNCRATDCYAGGVVRAFTSTWENNNFDAVTTAAMSTAVMLATEASGSLIIRGGKLRSRSATFAVGISVTGIFNPLIIDGVDIVGDTAGVYMQCSKIQNLLVRNCTTRSTNGVNIVYPTGSENLDFISGVVIEDNTFINYTGNMVTFRGSELITAPADRIYIRRNTGIPVAASSGNGILLRAEGWYGDDIEISDNAQLGDTSAVVSISPSQPYRVRSAPVVERNTNTPKTNNTHRVIGENTSGSYVSGATVLAGQILQRTRPGTATTFGWIVTTSGTEGTLSGVTSTIDVGVSTTNVALSGNAVDKVYPGCYITINGAGAASANLNTRVTAVAADYSSCTIETAASTSVTGATTAYRAPVFTAFATTS